MVCEDGTTEGMLSRSWEWQMLMVLQKNETDSRENIRKRRNIK